MPKRTLDRASASGTDAVEPSKKTARLGPEKPSYVLNVPVRVAASVNDDDTSDDSLSDDEPPFPRSYLKDPKQHFQIQKNSGVRQPKIVGNISANVQLPPNTHPQITQLIQCVEQQSFGSTPEEALRESQQRLALVFGLNAMRSISKTRNDAHRRIMQQPVSTQVSARQVGFFWEPRWRVSQDGKDWKATTWKEVRTFYRWLKRKDKRGAVQFRRAAEQSTEKEKIPVPFREIRETIRSHEHTETAITEQRTKRPEAPIYWGPLDADLVSLRPEANAQGSFSHYDRMVEEHYQAHGCELEIASVGYRISQEGSAVQPLLALAVELDLWVRDATAKIFPEGVCYPEPSTHVRVPPEDLTIVESFLGDGKPYSSPQEMQMLIRAVIERRKIDPKKTMRFDARGAIVTTTPKRMERLGLHGYANKKGLIVRWTEHQFRVMRDISQSHYTALMWAKNLFNALPGSETIQAIQRQKVISLMKRILSAYDVLERAQAHHQNNPEFGFQRSFAEVLNQKLVPVVQRVFKDRGESWQIDQIDNMEDLKAALNKYFKKDVATRVEAAAIQAITQVVRQFKEKLCIDFDALSKQLLLDSFHELANAEPADATGMHFPSLYDHIAAIDVFKGDKASDVESAFVDPAFKKLLSEAPKKERASVYGTTPMHWAAITGNSVLIGWLARQKQKKLVWASIVDKAAQGNVYPLHCALQYCAENGTDTDLLKLLCTRQSVNAKTEKNITALYLALTGLETAHPIVQHMLDLMTLEPDIKSALRELSEKVELWERKTLLLAILAYFPASPMRTKLVQYLIEQHQIPLDQRGPFSDEDPREEDADDYFHIYQKNEGTCGLLEAIAQNDLDVVELLLKNKADVDAVHGVYQSPVILHAMRTLSERKLDPLPMVKLLMQYEADINGRDAEGDYPLHKAIEDSDGCKTALVDFFIQHPTTQMDLRNEQYKKPYQVALVASDRACFDALLEHEGVTRAEIEADINLLSSKETKAIRRLTGWKLYSSSELAQARNAYARACKNECKRLARQGFFSDDGSDDSECSDLYSESPSDASSGEEDSNVIENDDNNSVLSKREKEEIYSKHLEEDYLHYWVQYRYAP